MQYTKTTFVDGTAPYINAENLNKIGSAIEALAKVTIEPCTFDGNSSTQALFILTTSDTAPQTAELPLLYYFVPTISNSAEAKCKPSWSGSAIDIYDTTTNDLILGGAIRANIPCVMYFDGVHFWVNGHGGGAFRLTSPGAGGSYEPGTFSRTNTSPDGETRLAYNGFFYATQMFADAYNCPAEQCLALGYNVNNVEAGDLIAITGSNTFAKNTIANNKNVVGIVTNNYMGLLGTEYGDTPVAFTGRVNAKVYGQCSAGDYLVASATAGCLEAIDYGVQLTAILAQALEDKASSEPGPVLVRIIDMPWKNGDYSGTFMITDGDAGTFSRTGEDPTATTGLEYNGYFSATRMYARQFNNPYGNNVAYGYPVKTELGVEVEAGDLIAVNTDGEFVLNDIQGNNALIGIVSDDYAALYGTEFGGIPIASSGRIQAKVYGACEAGDYLIGSAEPGCLEVADVDALRGSVVAQALVNKEEVETDKILVRIVNM